MKLAYHPDTDSLYIDLSEKPGADTLEVADGVVIDFDAEGHIAGIDIQHASQILSLGNIEAISLPAGIKMR